MQDQGTVAALCFLDHGLPLAVEPTHHPLGRLEPVWRDGSSDTDHWLAAAGGHGHCDEKGGWGQAGIEADTAAGGQLVAQGIASALLGNAVGESERDLAVLRQLIS